MALHMMNAVYIVQGEVNCVVTEMKRSLRQPMYQQNSPLINNFSQLTDSLSHISDLSEIEPSSFLGPFLELVRSEETTGWITGLALTSLNKFISYGFVDASARKREATSAAVESIADAVTHARFVGTDPESDEVVLMKILQVLRTLIISPCGRSLTNESICEIMQSCFRICFEARLSKLLRRTADHVLVEMIQLLFSRLPEFTEDYKWSRSMKKLKMRTGGVHQGAKKKTEVPRNRSDSISSNDQSRLSAQNNQPITEEQLSPQSANGEVSSGSPDATEDTNAQSDINSLSVELTSDGLLQTQEQPPLASPALSNSSEVTSSPVHMVDLHEGLPEVGQVDDMEPELSASDDLTNTSEGEDFHADTVDFINPKGVRFVPKRDGPVLPYGLPALRELFRFLISIMNPADTQNSDDMAHMGIYLITIALETAVDHIPTYSSLLTLVRNELCFNLFRQLHNEKLSIFTAALRACFLLFESMRSHLKFQVEMYLTKLMDIIVSENIRVTYEIKEIALNSLVQLWKIPGLVTELFLNYDCDVHCSNLFEDITKLLSKNAFPVTGLYTTHILSLDALLTVLESVEAHCHQRIMASKSGDKNRKSAPTRASHWRRPQLKPNRKLTASDTSDMPTLELLHSRKQQKQICQHAVELFNQKPKQGISYLREQGYLDSTHESVVKFIKETPNLNKALIGEYISRKDNPELTKAYMSSFDFRNKRLDEALRMLLETFRLPGESPVIEYLMEHFSSLWFHSNNEPFANVDAAFTLVYAIIMLNVDQHNNNAKKQNDPMTLEQFQRNLKKVNGGEDFDQEMLKEIFTAIHNEEIVLPEERTGHVKEVYTWKVLLSKSTESKDDFMHAPSGYYDSELFAIIWGPTIAALSFVFDKSQDQAIVEKAITGFRKCAMISAHYGLSEVFDNLIISLCKFTTFLNSAEASDQIPISFAANAKAQKAARTVFNLAHRHGDMLREGWKNILDCMLTLYCAKLLPHTFTEVEDFLHPERRVKLLKECNTADSRNDSGVINAFLTYFASDSGGQKGQGAEESKARDTSRRVIEECELDAVIDDTKFLRISSLQELVKALISLSQLENDDIESVRGEEMIVFFLELLIRVVLQNRDRASVVWQNVRDHLSSLILSSTDHTFIAERAVTGLLRISIRLLCREEVAAQVLPSLRILLRMKPTVLRSMSRQLAYGLHLLLETNAANIHSTEDWYCLFTLLEVVGAGGTIPDTESANSIDTGAQSDEGETSVSRLTPVSDMVDRGYTSDSELYDSHSNSGSKLPSASSSSDLTVGAVPDNSSWLLVQKKSQKNLSLDALPLATTVSSSKPQQNQFSICLEEELLPHDSQALIKCSEVLVLLVRDAAHITPYNFDSCVHAIRVFVEASMKSAFNDAAAKKKQTTQKHKDKKHKGKRDSHSRAKLSQSHSTPSRLSHTLAEGGEDREEGEVTSSDYKALSLQLLELMHTLHTRAASIFQSWAEEQPEEADIDGVCDAETSSLWRRCWCPLLQGLARLCTDIRLDVRGHAIRDLQRALLVQDLNQLSAIEWEACFNKVLFPLLTILLDKSNLIDPSGLEETRFRTSTLLSKVYLQHLTALLSLSTFTALWLTLLDFMDKYMQVDLSGQLSEGIPELLKNMLLVMGGMNLFYDESGGETQLCKLTCDRLNSFLPSLKRELFTPPTSTQTTVKEEISSAVTSPPGPENPPTVNDLNADPEPRAPSPSEVAPVRTASPTPTPTSIPAPTPFSTPNVEQPSSPASRPASPEQYNHRSTSPLVHTMPASAFTIQLHPPLAPPIPMTAPTLVPVSEGYTPPPSISSYFTQPPSLVTPTVSSGSTAVSISSTPGLLLNSSPPVSSHNSQIANYANTQDYQAMWVISKDSPTT